MNVGVGVLVQRGPSTCARPSTSREVDVGADHLERLLEQRELRELCFFRTCGLPVFGSFGRHLHATQKTFREQHTHKGFDTAAHVYACVWCARMQTRAERGGRVA